MSLITATYVTYIHTYIPWMICILYTVPLYSYLPSTNDKLISLDQ